MLKTLKLLGKTFTARPAPDALKKTGYSLCNQVGVVPSGDNIYVDCGNVMYKQVGNRIVETPYCSNGVEVVTPLSGETDSEGVKGYYEVQSE